jgi:hypothetical protein
LFWADCKPCREALQIVSRIHLSFKANYSVIQFHYQTKVFSTREETTKDFQMTPSSSSTPVQVQQSLGSLQSSNKKKTKSLVALYNSVMQYIIEYEDNTVQIQALLLALAQLLSLVHCLKRMNHTPSFWSNALWKAYPEVSGLLEGKITREMESLFNQLRNFQ